MSLSSEFEWVRWFEQFNQPKDPSVIVGIGDDAAVLSASEGPLVVSTDALVENVHFKLDWINANELGHKALAINLSDLAAMGAIPKYFLVSLGLRPDLDDEFLEAFYQGMLGLAGVHGVSLIGGNLARTHGGVWVSITILGETKGKPKTRCQLKVGQRLAVTGKLGGAAAGLRLLKEKGRQAAERDAAELVKAQLLPQARVAEGIALSEFEGALIDLSDGLSSDLTHLTRASGVGAVIDKQKIPVVEGATVEQAIHGGEDYELLFSFDKKDEEQVKQQIQCFVIGEVTQLKDQVQVKDGAALTPLRAKGWEHF